MKGRFITVLITTKKNGRAIPEANNHIYQR